MNEPEVQHFISLIDGELCGYAKLTATAETDWRIERNDGKGPWEPMDDGVKPVWYRVSEEIAVMWSEDDDDRG